MSDAIFEGKKYKPQLQSRTLILSPKIWPCLQADTSGPSPSQSSPTSPPQFAKFSSTVADESISDERVLGQYLDEYDAW